MSLPVSFGNPRNTRTEYITFDVVDMNYPYNAIFRSGLLNTFNVALHSLYLCRKVPAALGVISIHDSEKDSRNIEQDFAPGHRNTNYLQDTKAEDCIDTTARKDEGSFVSRPAIEPECKTKRVPLDPRTPNKVVMISQDLSSSEETEMLSFLDKIVIFSHGKPLISLGSSSEEIEAPQNV
jgi:hypothetical protein